MTTALNQLNALSSSAAVQVFLSCCGSTLWAQALSARRPFASTEALYTAADEIWWQLKPEDWREAFAAHPEIGARKSQPDAGASVRFSTQEQAQVTTAEHAIKDQLLQANREYRDKHGFIFIICATGKSASVMLEALRLRLQNDTSTELHNAAVEQGKITRLRLDYYLKDAITIEKLFERTRS